MFEVLARYLKRTAFLTDEEIAQVREYASEKTLRRKEYLLREGQFSNFNCFVAKGCMRLYHVDAEGSEHILKFAVEDWWISDYESYNTGNPAKNNIDALENCELIIFQKTELDGLFKSIPNFQAFKERVDARSFNASQQRILNIISNSAEGRYESFIKAYPDVTNRIPLHMIASYLGLTRETLSRVRSHYAKTKRQ